MVHPDDRERVMALVRESIDRLVEWNAEFRLLYPDGSVRWMLSKGTLLLDDDGRPARMVGVSIDITERKRTEPDVRSPRCCVMRTARVRDPRHSSERLRVAYLPQMKNKANQCKRHHGECCGFRNCCG